MSELTKDQRLQLLAGLVDGNSERAIERMTGTSRLTIRRFALRMGRAAWHLHNTMAHDLAVSLIEQDEVWSYCKLKDARATDEQRAAGLGERYTFVGLAMPSRYVVTWKVGRRDQETTDAFIADMRDRLVTMPTITSDGLSAYVSAIGREFGPGVDYGQTVKNYRKSGRKDDDHRYEPPREPFITKKSIFGAPDMGRATTAHVERQHATMRHRIGRIRRLVYAFSKDPAHHAAAVSLGYLAYNVTWILRTTRVTPAMAVGATDHLWDLPELLDALLSVPETATPTRKPLAPRKPETTARELPNGRGFLRVAPGGGGKPAPERPQGPAPVPAASAVGAPAVAAPAPVDDRQLSLLDWRPRPKAEPSPEPPPAPVAPAAPSPSRRLDADDHQLSLLFGIDLDPKG